MATRSMPFWPRPATTSGSLWPGSGLCAPFSGRLSWSGMTRAAPPPHPPEHANSLFHRRRATHDMRRAFRFYQALGFEVLHGDEASSFTSFRAGTSYLNLITQPGDRQWSWWGRVIFYVADVDELFERARAAGFSPATAPRNAEWGERYFHLTDPDGHELSFARPLLPQA